MGGLLAFGVSFGDEVAFGVVVVGAAGVVGKGVAGFTVFLVVAVGGAVAVRVGFSQQVVV